MDVRGLSRHKVLANDADLAECISCEANNSRKRSLLAWFESGVVFESLSTSMSRSLSLSNFKNVYSL